jgi:hypothetical protein
MPKQCFRFARESKEMAVECQSQCKLILKSCDEATLEVNGTVNRSNSHVHVGKVLNLPAQFTTV